jgi:hypothetical protein
MRTPHYLLTCQSLDSDASFEVCHRQLLVEAGCQQAAQLRQRRHTNNPAQ